MEKLLAILFGAPLVLGALALLGLLLSVPLYFAWNYDADLFHVPHLTWLQAWALSVVAASLIKPSSVSSS